MIRLRHRWRTRHWNRRHSPGCPVRYGDDGDAECIGPDWWCIPARCMTKGHDWKQEIYGQLGYQVCRRWRCAARRVDPKALPPWHPDAYWNRSRRNDSRPA